MLSTFQNLSHYQVQALRDAGVINGCGPGCWRRVIPQVFKMYCDEHDYNYAVGGTEERREFADRVFYIQCKSMARNWYERLLAWYSYRAVRLLGKSRFKYGQPRTYNQVLTNV
jgi:hypothetical protein